ncbi:ubiquinone/menaquinone biosynthesis C-methylase UbiE [Rubricella aquisinus]|uniref:Ubiquinone/menaquinone biosynthesis C-methylase UbiE n=1 Tax=Rubricella aquisinus TaxID=2028108 RepID=A0A840WY80_9RHOB|nr:class I SAM-dependent methyltransferase [Rubricella aquisinus]MBB5514625.1 ubiquinone/menaquinone biosynthesis C-methylase UbiE [Rubricella aquisinus]
MAGKPKGNKYYGPVAENYVRRRKKQQWWHQEQAAMEALLTKLPDGLSVLDVPFGTGRFTKMFDAKGYDIHGLDISGDMLAAARAENGDALIDACTLEIGSSDNLPFKDRQFDLLVSVRFLSNIIVKDVALASLREFRRVTDGHAILQLAYTHEGGIDVPGNEVMDDRMSKKDTIGILTDAGFKVIDQIGVKDVEENNSTIYMFLCETV